MFGRVMDHVAPLTECGEVMRPVVAGIVVQMRAGEDDARRSHLGRWVDAGEPQSRPRQLFRCRQSGFGASRRAHCSPTRARPSEPEAEAARVADLAIVPAQPSPDDFEAVGETLKILHRLDQRAVVIVNATSNDLRATAARAALSRDPVPVCPTHLSDRTVYLDASLKEGASLKCADMQPERDSEMSVTWVIS